MAASRRKKYQRSLNHLVRAINRNIANDDLWLGRFELRQKDASYEEFEDHSGGVLYVNIRVYDKATGYFKDYRMDFAPYYMSNGWHLWEIANKFITEDCGVWKSNPRPYEKGFVKDYRNQSIPEAVMKKDYNWFISYQYWNKE